MIPNITIASPPRNVMYWEYCIATSVATNPINSHTTTAKILNNPKTLGFTPATTPCDAKIRFSIFPKIIRPTKDQKGRQYRRPQGSGAHGGLRSLF